MWALIEEGGIWVSILRPSMFSLEIVERTRLKIITAWFLLTSSAGGGGGGVLALARSLRFRTVLTDFPKEKENNVC